MFLIGLQSGDYGHAVPSSPLSEKRGGCRFHFISLNWSERWNSPAIRPCASVTWPTEGTWSHLQSNGEVAGKSHVTNCQLVHDSHSVTWWAVSTNGLWAASRFAFILLCNVGWIVALYGRHYRQLADVSELSADYLRFCVCLWDNSQNDINRFFGLIGHIFIFLHTWLIERLLTRKFMR